LWDPGYVEESWITRDVLHGPIALLPRLDKKIADNYPGTLLSISEYNYGGGADISGGIAEADVLGIFGRENLFAAAEWPLSNHERFIDAALAMYRNFDGAEGAFGNRSIHSETDQTGDTSIYASVDSTGKGRAVLVAINKTDHAISAAVHLAGLPPFGHADVYVLTSANPRPQPANAVAIAGSPTFNYTMPPYSVSTLRLTR